MSASGLSRSRIRSISCRSAWATIAPDPGRSSGRLAKSDMINASSSGEISRLRDRGGSGSAEKCCDMIEIDDPENGRVPVADS